ncbi:hypothetical protein BJF79_33040 [Actinomadura sp. CNU-125]|uniref:hypothetical protein n=1 Tax=Actinomadura sp. CNU-125 TaxID=1904961 RepID=UPI00095E071E|nr:hypothetical protein [Actinomadura sp. CNU-125]OLT34682.1 hypothetical protein BJF79_33040 [Actinomadura sp. CNU-125]
MRALNDLASLATRGEWARREHARLQAEAVEARLAARADAAGPAVRLRRWLTGGVSGRLGAARRGARTARPVRPVRPVTPVGGCRRAAASSFHVARTAGGTR